MHKLSILAAILLTTVVSMAQTRDRSLSFSIDINAPVDTVWSRWSSVSGLTKFFAPAAVMELQTLGRLEILFSPASPEGQRGAENNRILAFQNKQMISFTWDAPPAFPEIRKQRTVVVVRLYPSDVGKTTVTLTQTGFGTGSDWDAVYKYFEPAWSTIVLPNLKYSCEVGALNMKDFPRNAPKDLAPAKKL